MAYVFDKPVGIVILSEPAPLAGENHRSSGNYDFRALKNARQIRWKCEPGISFKVMRDEYFQDPVLWKDVRNNTVTDYIDLDKIYIADPEGAREPFRIEIESAPDAEWMSYVDDGMLLSEISIPGTHESATYQMYIGNCQNLTIREQLQDYGVRFLDIRLKFKSGELWVYHEIESAGNLTLNDVCQECYEFLDRHPTECIVMSIRDEQNDTERRYVHNFENRLKSCIQAKADYWSTRDETPRLGDVRKKIVLFRRFRTLNTSEELGIDARPEKWQDKVRFTIDNGDEHSQLYIQDVYHLESQKWQDKFAEIAELLKPSSQYQNYWRINFASGYTSTLLKPYCIRCFSDFINPKLSHYFTENPAMPAGTNGYGYGTILLDFIDEKAKYLTRQIYMSNIVL